MSTLREMQRVALAAIILAALGVAMALYSLSLARRPPEQMIDALGITLGATGRPDQLVIDSMRGDGLGRQAGLRVGDIVEGVNGHAATSPFDFSRSISSRNSVDIRVRRGEKDVDVIIAIGPGGRIGKQDPLDRGRRRHG